MPQPNQVLVSGAGTTAVNGTYTQGADMNSRPAYYLDTNNDIRLYTNSAGPNSGWVIRLLTGAQTYYYSTTLSATGSVPLSPVGIVLNTGINPFTGGSLAGIAPVPTVNVPINCADPLERCAFAAGGESGRSRFRRLVALGYV